MAEKRKRVAAKGRFTRTVNSLDKFLGEPDGDDENAEKFFLDVEAAWMNVEEKHEEDTATLDENADTRIEDEWINEVQKTYHDIRKRYVKFKSVTELKCLIASKEKSRSVMYETFLNLLKNVELSINNKLSREIIVRERTVLDKQFEIVKTAHSEYSICCEDDAESVNNEWLAKLMLRFSKINNDIDDYLKLLPIKSEKKNHSEVPGTQIKLDKMPLPKFFGESRFQKRF